MKKTIKNTEQTGVADYVNQKDIFEVRVKVELMCVKCGKRWIDEIDKQTRLKDIRCGLCGLTGYVINTGQGWL